jgi:ribonucleoside-diphosphate reductase alpha chain
MQAAFQKYTDNAVSKTINFSTSATKEDIRMAFEYAYELGCKGLTVYRDGSRDNQVLQTMSSPIQQTAEEKKVEPRNRPEITQGITQKVETGCGHMYVTINSDEFGACEVFVQMGKVGGCASAQLEAIARLASLALRSNLKVDALVRQLKGIRCQSPMWNKGRMITSCGDAVGQALEQFLSLDLQGRSSNFEIPSIRPAHAEYGAQRSIAMCPDCGNSIEHLEGCLKCPSCGWSKC